MAGCASHGRRERMVKRVLEEQELCDEEEGVSSSGWANER